MTSTEPVVTLEGVTKRYGPVTAVDRVSLEIRRGEFFSLLGPSGCGKTTLLRTVAGFLAPDEGRVLINGSDVIGVPPNKRPSNMVFQDYALFPHLDVAANIAFGLREARMPRAEIAQRVDDVLRIVHLEGLERRRPRQLSGGQQQRVALARALVKEPVVLLLDEPLGALDLKLRKAMQLELKRIQREVGITFIYVTHDQDEALTMSDRIAVMNQGRCEQVDRPDEIYERPTTLFVADFIGDANLVPVRIGSLDGNEARVELPGREQVTSPVGELGAAVGAMTTLLVRPERVRISTDEAGARGERLRGTLVEAVYQGATIRYEVELPSGVRFVCVAPKEERPGAQPGDHVWLSWDPGYGRLLEGVAEKQAAPADAAGDRPTSPVT
jgi:spermidine/putrescine transport system ATP-binding protein